MLAFLFGVATFVVTGAYKLELKRFDNTKNDIAFSYNFNPMFPVTMDDRFSQTNDSVNVSVQTLTQRNSNNVPLCSMRFDMPAKAFLPKKLIVLELNYDIQPSNFAFCDMRTKLLELEMHRPAAVFLVTSDSVNKNNELLYLNPPTFLIRADQRALMDFLRYVDRIQLRAEFAPPNFFGIRKMQRFWRGPLSDFLESEYDSVHVTYSTVFMLIFFALFTALFIVCIIRLVFPCLHRLVYVHHDRKRSRWLLQATRRALREIPVKQLKQIDSQLTALYDQCTVCIDLFKPHDHIRLLPCGHFYHKSCIDPWLLAQQSCPLCKMDILESCGLYFDASSSFGHEEEDETEDLYGQANRSNGAGAQQRLLCHPLFCCCPAMAARRSGGVDEGRLPAEMPVFLPLRVGPPGGGQPRPNHEDEGVYIYSASSTSSQGRTDTSASESRSPSSVATQHNTIYQRRLRERRMRQRGRTASWLSWLVGLPRGPAPTRRCCLRAPKKRVRRRGEAPERETVRRLCALHAAQAPCLAEEQALGRLFHQATIETRPSFPLPSAADPSPSLMVPPPRYEEDSVSALQPGVQVNLSEELSGSKCKRSDLDHLLRPITVDVGSRCSGELGLTAAATASLSTCSPLGSRESEACPASGQQSALTLAKWTLLRWLGGRDRACPKKTSTREMEEGGGKSRQQSAEEHRVASAATVAACGGASAVCDVCAFGEAASWSTGGASKSRGKRATATQWSRKGALDSLRLDPNGAVLAMPERPPPVYELACAALVTAAPTARPNDRLLQLHSPPTAAGSSVP